MTDVLFERDCLQVHGGLTVSQLLHVHNSLVAAREQLEQHLGGSAARQSCVKTLLSYLPPSFVDEVAHFVSDEVAAHHVGFKDVASSVMYSLDLEFWFMMELLCTMERGVRLSTTIPET